MSDSVISGYAERIERNLYSRTDEKEIVGQLLREMLSDRQQSRCLDVGPGPGTLTRVLDDASTELTLVEWNRSYERVLRESFPRARLLLASVEEVELPTWHFDVILLSHVLYYLPVERWRPLCERLFQSLSPGGLLIVILNDTSGDWWQVVAAFWERLRSHLRFHYQSPDILRSALDPLGDDTQSVQYPFVIRFDDIPTMATALGEQLLQIADAAVLADEAGDLLELAHKLFEQNGGPELRATGRVLTVRRAP